MISEKEIRLILHEPEQYIDSKEFFSWERFFVKVLIEKTQNTYMQYKKQN